MKFFIVLILLGLIVQDSFQQQCWGGCGCGGCCGNNPEIMNLLYQILNYVSGPSTTYPPPPPWTTVGPPSNTYPPPWSSTGSPTEFPTSGNPTATPTPTYPPGAIPTRNFL